MSEKTQNPLLSGEGEEAEKRPTFKDVRTLRTRLRRPQSNEYTQVEAAKRPGISTTSIQRWIKVWERGEVAAGRVSTSLPGRPLWRTHRSRPLPGPYLATGAPHPAP